MAELGFGIMRFRDQKGREKLYLEKVISEYMKGEYCYFDIHPAYCDGKAQQIFKDYVSSRYKRSQYLIANKMPYYGIEKYDDYINVFRKELAECDVDYFDFYMLHCINERNYLYHKELGGFVFLKEIRKKYANKVGISFHGTPELLKEILTVYEYIDFVQLQLNFYDWDNPIIQSRRCYELAIRFGKEIVVMEPIKGGTLSRNMCVNNVRFDASQMADISLRFLNNMKGVSVILSGMTEINHVANNRDSIKKSSLPYSYFESLINEMKKEQVVQCTKCRYCTLDCPKNIRIPEILECLNEGLENEEGGKTRFPFSRLNYRSIFQRQEASECIKCGKCESVCPQNIYIRNCMSIAAKVFDQEESEYDVYSIQLKKSFLSHQVRRSMGGGKTYKVFAYGAGVVFEKMAHLITDKCVLQGVIDMNEAKHGTNISGVQCIGLRQVSRDAFIIIITRKESVFDEIAQRLENEGYTHFDSIWNWLSYADDFQWES